MDVTNIVKRDRETFIKYLLHVETQLKKLYGNTYAKAMQLQQVRESIEAGAPFTWKGNPQAEKQLDKLLNNMAGHTDQLIVQGVTKQYTNGQKAATQMVDANFTHNKKVVADLSQEATEQHRLSVSKTFTSATGAQGMTLSKRVWVLNDQSKTELEIAIQNAIIEGKSADEATRDIKKYLNNPNALFKRVRDKETGELVLSDAAKNYHPGQGVYRSAYKNAMRMARTEINAAYLRAEIESYQSNPLVTGYEIKLSGNHTTTLPNGKVVHLTDICDKLAGKYPKTFMFTGWHPQCRCYVVPITIRDAELTRQLEKDGEVNTDAKQITDVPDNMHQWLDDNQQRIDNAKQLPPFIEQNKKLIGQRKYGYIGGFYGSKLGRKATNEARMSLSTHTESHQYTQQQIDNLNDIAREMGWALNKPKTFEEADNGKSNIYDDKDNCAACVVSHELRLRGFNVTALNYDESENSISCQLSDKTELAWETHKGKIPEQTIIKGDKNEMLRQIEKLTEPIGSRYHLGWDNKEKDGHIITLERTKQGLIYYDPQKNCFYSFDAIYRDIKENSNMQLLRVDRLLFNKNIIKALFLET